MRISRVLLSNFKRFERFEIDLKNRLTADVADQFLILGDNGTGKTTVLQAIALCLSKASGSIRNISEFDWQGWVSGRYEKWGTPTVELDVHFSGDEISATNEVAKKWLETMQPVGGSTPNQNRKLTVRLHGEWVEAIGEDGQASRENLFQFRGRYYATQLIKTSPWARDYFARLPGVFWFDQYRNLATPPIRSDESGYTGRVSYDIGVARLRRYLNSWKLNQMAGMDGGPDWLMELENAYKRVFPGRSFRGPEPMYHSGDPAPEDYYFTLSDGNRTYDVEEMSAGEQSVFPMLFEFVRMQIRNSIVLIDEVDLNLHPPLAQSLVTALPNIGPNCQFILTTHSEAVSALSSPEEVYRLPGGKLCL